MPDERHSSSPLRRPSHHEFDGQHDRLEGPVVTDQPGQKQLCRTPTHLPRVMSNHRDRQHVSQLEVVEPDEGDPGPRAPYRVQTPRLARSLVAEIAVGGSRMDSSSRIAASASSTSRAPSRTKDSSSCTSALATASRNPATRSPTVWLVPGSPTAPIRR